MGPYTRKIEKRTIIFFAVFVFLIFLLYLRIGILSNFSGLENTSSNQSRYTVTLDKERGMIYDRNLSPLVNRIKEETYAVLPDKQNMNAVLGSVEDSRREGVLSLLESGKPFVLKTDKNIQAPNVTKFYKTQRYEYFQLASHIIGYTDGEDNGVTGIEKSYNNLLKENTVKTTASYVLNGLGHGMPGLDAVVTEDKKENGGVVLTIDKDIQSKVQSIGSRMIKKGAIVVMDPYTGEIKATASFPSYTPRNIEKSISDTENSPMINRAFLPFNVGSTFKIVTAATALESGIDMKFCSECKGVTDVSGQSIKCHNRNGHGELDMLDAMKESCNPYFIEIGLKVGGEKLLTMAEKFGFGRGFSLADGIYTANGSLPQRSELINPAEVANLSFGQGKLTATPVQIAQMVSIIANGGYYVTPKLVLGTTKDGKITDKFAVIPKERVISNLTAAQIQSFLIHCVMVADGQNAKPQKTTAGGKTATAQTGRYVDGEEKEHGWFAGFFPAVNPEYVVVVLCEDAGFGNNTASPVFSKIADSILN